MGHWTITIVGHGIHDNGRQDDADQMAAAFVGELRAAGHEVTDAGFSLQAKSLLPLVPSVVRPFITQGGQDDETSL
jgi:hypothetical protein